MANAPVLVPKTINEQLLYSTVRIVGKSGTGTGFFFKAKISESHDCVFIITNNHVVANESKISISLHIGNEGIPTSENINVDVELKDMWIPHPDENVDLCAILAVPIINLVKNKLNKHVFYRTLNEELIKDDEELLEMTDVRDDISMIGYPYGLTDMINNFPIFRSGNCASHPGIDFDGSAVGVVDMACFHGSSGSPIVLFKQNYNDKDGNLILGGNPIFILLGVLDRAAYCTKEGQIILKDIPTSTKQLSTKYDQMIHLGYYIKAKKIFDLVQVIKTNIDKRSGN